MIAYSDSRVDQTSRLAPSGIPSSRPAQSGKEETKRRHI